MHHQAWLVLPCMRVLKGSPQIPQEGLNFRVCAHGGGDVHMYMSVHVIGGSVFVCLSLLACRRGASLLTSTGVARETSAMTA